MSVYYRRNAGALDHEEWGFFGGTGVAVRFVQKVVRLCHKCLNRQEAS